MLLRALVVARETKVRRCAAHAAESVDSIVTEASSFDDLRRELGKKPFDLVFLAIDSEHGDPISLIEEIRSVPETPEVIVLAAGEDPEYRAELLTAGCLAVLSDSLPDSSLDEVVATFAARRRGEAGGRLGRIPADDYRLGDYASASPSMGRFLSLARRVASKDSTLLILGETGVGKGLLARAIHNEGPRSGGPFVGVNCGAIPESLLESEMFGHEKGAFTGADRARRGHFELAHRGTVFLDEVSELPLPLQVKLLRVLEDRCVQPVGSERSIRLDVRIMAASNRDLSVEVEEGRFRRDLYYRLNVVSLTLPPLRERREDIPELLQSYVEHFRETLNSHVTGAAPGVLEVLTRYAWPGNVREFINAIERAAILCDGAEIQVTDLPLDIQGAVVAESWETARLDAGQVLPHVDTDWLDRPWSEVRARILEETERRYLAGLLEACAGRINETAERSGLDPRSLYDKMKRHGLRKEDFRPARRRAG
jgi:DNA-binding NtrC family response regulator